MGKKCCVPHCYTGYRNHDQEKLPMYGVPKNDFFLSQWQEAIARADRPITPNDRVCQKHFQREDLIHRRFIKGEIEEYKVPKLKPDAIPSIFPETPDSIHGCVKKRRKLSIDTELYKKSLENKIKENKCNIKKEETAMINNDITIKTEPADGFQTKKDCDNDNESSQETNAIIPVIILKEELHIKDEPENSSQEDENPTDCIQENENIFKCKLCDYSTKWSNNLQTHQIKHLEGDEYYFKCEQCPNFKTKWNTTLKNHMKIKHNTEPLPIFKCFICQFQTKVKICLKRHMRRHQLVGGLLECSFSECYYRTSCQNDLSTHLKTHDSQDISLDKPLDLSVSRNNASNFKCVKCDYHTSSHIDMLKHIFTHNCETNEQTVHSNVESPKDTVDYDGKCNVSYTTFDCKECNYKSNEKAEFLKHCLMHRDVSVEVCNKNSN